MASSQPAQQTLPLPQNYKKIIVKASEFGSRDFAMATHIVNVSMQPTPPGHINIKIVATGIEASDVIQMAGGYGALNGKRPESFADGSHQLGDLGCEGVGLVAELGEGVDPTQWLVGQAVAFMGFGVSFREYITLPATTDHTANLGIIKVPDARPEWTAVPVSAMTAVGGLVLAGGIAAGQSVLVTGAAGGTGHIAVQWAKRMGARVAGTCGSDAKVAMLKDLGCDVVVNYREQDVEKELRLEFPKGFDLVYDGVGGKVGRQAQRLLSTSGTIVSVGSVANDYTGAGKGDSVDSPPPERLPGQTYTGFFMPSGPGYAVWPQLIQEVVSAISSGELRVVMDEACKQFPVGVEGVYMAQSRIRSGQNEGKIYAAISA